MYCNRGVLLDLSSPRTIGDLKVSGIERLGFDIAGMGM